MKLCDAGHAPIAHARAKCPLCTALRERDAAREAHAAADACLERAVTDYDAAMLELNEYRERAAQPDLFDPNTLPERDAGEQP